MGLQRNQTSARARQQMLYQRFQELLGLIILLSNPGWLLLRTAGFDAAYCSAVSKIGCIELS